MRIPHHPVGERAACWFHLGLAVVGVAHIACGIAMIWFHGTGAKRHYEAIEE